MKKVQVMLPDNVAKEFETIKAKEGFESESELGRHVITEWMTLKRYGLIKDAPTARLTEIATLFSGRMESQLAEA